MRNLWTIFCIFLVTVFYCTRALLLYPFGDRDRRFFTYMRRWAHTTLRLARVTIEVQGGGNVPKGGQCVYVSNHASLFDIPVLIAGIDDDIRIMYKRELQEIPVFGWILALSPFIPVTRNDPRDAMTSIDRAADSIRAGASVIIFAEGTRSPDGRLGAFKRGAFMLAARAQRPVIPVAIIGSSAILPSKTSHIRPGHVRLVIKQPIATTTTENRAAEKELMQTVHASIAAELSAPPSP